MLLKDENINHKTLTNSPQINGGTMTDLKKDLSPSSAANYSKNLDAHFTTAPTSSSPPVTSPHVIAQTPHSAVTQRPSLRKPYPLMTPMAANSNSTPPVFRPKKVLTLTSPVQKTIPIQKRASAQATSPKSPPLPAYTQLQPQKSPAETLKAIIPTMPSHVADQIINSAKIDENVKPTIHVKGKLTNATVDRNCSECICDRPPAMVVCQRCGNELYGRVQRICSTHPKRICLMDQRECVNSFCRSIHLSEIQKTQRKA